MCRGIKDMLSCLLLLQEEPGHYYSRYEIVLMTNLGPGLVEHIMERLIGMDMVKASEYSEQTWYQYQRPLSFQCSWEQLNEVRP